MKVVFTDGACSANGAVNARAGAGVAVYVDGVLTKIISQRVEIATNNRGEWLAMILGLAEDPDELVSDSRNCIMTLTDWLPARRKKNKEGGMLNLDLIQAADVEYKRHPTIFRHVNSHTAVGGGNHVADAVAEIGRLQEDYSVHITMITPDLHSDVENILRIQSDSSRKSALVHLLK